MNAAEPRRSSRNLNELIKEIEMLIERCQELAEHAAKHIVKPLAIGNSPDLAVLAGVQSVVERIQSLNGEAHRLRVGNSDESATIALNLHQLLDLTREAAKGLQTVREDCLEDARRILRVTAKNGPTPAYLNQLHELAEACCRELANGHDSQTVSANDLRTQTRPFRDIWSILESPDGLSDEVADEILRRLEDQFGRGLVSAITLRRLVVVPERNDLNPTQTKPVQQMPAEPSKVAPVTAETRVPTKLPPPPDTISIAQVAVSSNVKDSKTSIDSIAMDCSTRAPISTPLPVPIAESTRKTGQVNDVVDARSPADRKSGILHRRHTSASSTPASTQARTVSQRRLP